MLLNVNICIDKSAIRSSIFQYIDFAKLIYYFKLEN